MPIDRGGSFECARCGAAGFRSYEEACDHEKQCPGDVAHSGDTVSPSIGKKRPRPGNFGSAEEAQRLRRPPPRPQGQHRPESSSSVGDETHLEQRPSPSLLVHEMGGPVRTASQIMPPNLAGPLQPHFHHPESVPPSRGPHGPQRTDAPIPSPSPYFAPTILLPTDEMGRPMSAVPPDLPELDSIICQNVELFQATPEDVADSAAGRSNGGMPTEPGQIGIRCIHCVARPFALVEYSTMYPGNISHMSRSLRLMADEHFPRCPIIPPPHRDQLARANDAQKRRESTAGQDDFYQRPLVEFCHSICNRVGVVNKGGRTGLVYDSRYIPNDTDTTAPSSDPFLPANTGAAFGESSIGPSGTGVMATPVTKRQRQQQGSHLKPEQEGGPSSQDVDPSQASYRPESGQYTTSSASGYPTSSYSQPPHWTPSAMTPHGHDVQSTQPQPISHMYPPSSSSGGLPPGEQPPGGSYGGAMPPMSQGTSSAASYDPSMHSLPFYHDPYNGWFCRYCGHVPPHYRAPNYMWSPPDHSPPPFSFMEQHLASCPYAPRGMSGSSGSSMPPNTSYSQQGGMYPPSSYGGYPPQQSPPPGYPQASMGGSWGGSGQPSSMMPMPHGSASQGPPYYSHGQGSEPPPHYMYGQHHPQYQGQPGGMLPLPADMPPGSSGVSSSPGNTHPPVSIGPGSTPQPHGGEGTDAAVQAALDHLISVERELYRTHGQDAGDLVMENDKDLLTNYFYHLMKQLRICRFSESDRKTRGGKRENVAIGFGGLQCVHCSETPNSRKFFWSNVDRLANSFAEIPSHVLKCRRCPTQTKHALQELKQRHPEEMARLPRGSQKVFFRRMWRRLHDDDPEPPPETPAPATPGSPGAKERAAGEEEGSQKGEDVRTPSSSSAPAPKEEDASAAVASTPSSEPLRSPPRSAARQSFTVGGSTATAARSLAASATTPTKDSPVLLAIDEDREWLSDTDCLVRANLEAFCATEDDVATAQADGNYPVNLGQVGIRCVHCAYSTDGNVARGHAVAYPRSIGGIYESVREFQRLHLESCPNLPGDVKEKLGRQRGSTSLSSVLRRYYVAAAKNALGMYDTQDGIRASGESRPLGLSTHEQPGGGGGEPVRLTSGAPSMPLVSAVTPLESRRRRMSQPPPSAGAEDQSYKQEEGHA